jgi:hypothetical protein
VVDGFQSARFYYPGVESGFEGNMDEAERQREIESLTELLERPVKVNLAIRAIYR